MSKRVVIRSLKEATLDGPRVVIGSNLSPKEAERMLRTFTKLKWEERRPGAFTIDHIMLCIEETSE